MRVLPRKSRSLRRLDDPMGRRGLGGAVRVRAGLLGVGALVLVGVLLLSATAAPEAEALSIPNPVSVLGSGLSALLGVSVGPIVSLVVKAFAAILNHLFAPLAKFVTVAVVGWLTSIPNFAQGNVAHLETTVAVICGGVLGAVATLSIIRYWLAGFAGGGGSGFAGVEGLIRTTAAAFFIAAWPSLFGLVIHLTNALTSQLLSAGITKSEMADLIRAGLGAGIVGWASSPIGWFLGIVVAVAASLLFLGLLLLKIVVSISTILLFVGMPLVAVLWPVAPWIGRLVGRAFGVCLAVPVLWTLCFLAAGALAVDTLTLKQLTGSLNGVLNTLISPLVAIVLLYVMVRLPLHLSRIAMLGGVALGGGFVSRTVSSAVGPHVRGMATQHLPESLGGRPAARQSESELGRKIRLGVTGAGVAATGGTAAGAAAASRAASAGSGAKAAASGAAQAGRATTATRKNGGASARGNYSPPPIVQAEASGEALQTAVPEPPWNEGLFRGEMRQAEQRAAGNPLAGHPPTVGETRAALGGLSRGAQRTAEQLDSDHGADARRDYAYMATDQNIGEQEREAWRTLAAATPQVRSEAFRALNEDQWVVHGATEGSSGDSVVASASEAPITDPRPVGDDVSPSSSPGTGEPTEPDAFDSDPERKQARKTPSAGTGGTSPPAPKRTDLRQPPTPRDQGGGS